MSVRQAFLDEGIGESRGVVLLDGEAEHLLIQRDDDDSRGQVGARLAGRVRKVEPAFASAFLDLGGGLEAMMAFKPDSRPVEGQLLEVEIRTEARAGKLATVRVIGPATGAPGLLAKADDLRAQLAHLVKDDALILGAKARVVADLAETEALETVHPLPGGGSIAIEPTRALVAIDVDLGERKGQDAKRLTRQSNLVALAQAARLLRLKGLGGIVVIDLVGRGHDGNAMMTAARTAFSPDNPGVAIGPIGRFGTMELSIPRRGRSIREVLLDSQGQPSTMTLAYRLIRQAETTANLYPGRQVLASAAPEIVALAGPLAQQVCARIGNRLTLSADSSLSRDRLEVRAP